MKTARILRWVRRPRGAAAVEYGLILPALLLFIIGIMDIGRLSWTFVTLNRAAEAAARCGAVDATACATTAQIQARGVTEAWGLRITSAAFAVTKPACGVRVVGTYPFVFAIPALFGAAPLGTLTLSATACYPLMH